MLFCFAGIARSQQPDTSFVAASYGEGTKGAVGTSALEHRVFDLVNNERINNGRSPLLWRDQIAGVARYHSSNMATYNFLGHEDRDGRRPSGRADLLGLRDWRQIGENIAWISGRVDPAARVVECWMRSPGHRQNMLDPTFRESGIGLAFTADGKYYFTQVFIVRK